MGGVDSCVDHSYENVAISFFNAPCSRSRNVRVGLSIHDAPVLKSGPCDSSLGQGPRFKCGQHCHCECGEQGLSEAALELHDSFFANHVPEAVA